MRITPVSLLRLATKCCGRLVDVGSPWCREPVASVTWGPQAPRTAAASANPRFFNERSLQATSYRRPRRWEAEMDTLVERCGGLDVHKAQVTATVRIDERGAPREQHTQTFATTTRGLLALADWLASWHVTRVGMEATGVYWKPVYYALEDSFETWLLNAQHLKNVPGRKTDVADSVWIAQLVAHGLVRPSFVPPKEIRELRDLTRYQEHHRGTHPGGAAPRQGPPGRRDQADQRRVADPGGVRTADAGGAGVGHPRSRGARRFGPRAAAREAARPA